jgi:hypothetical protein
MVPYIHQYSSWKKGGILCLLLRGGGKYTHFSMGVISLTLCKKKRKRKENILPLIPSDLLLFRFMVLFALGFMIGKVEGWGAFT